MLLRTTILIAASVFAMQLLAASTPCWADANEQHSPLLPRVFLFDPVVLQANQAELLAGDDRLKPALEALKAQADQALELKPVSVVDKTQLPPSGDKHDYLSIAIYAWPNPLTKDGLPWLIRDGERNPAVDDIPDKKNKNLMQRTAQTLALAYYFTKDERYAEHASQWLRMWFIEPDTRMNPHLRYAQGIPGLYDGRAFGIIDTAQLGQVADAVGLLADSQHWTTDDQQAMEQWFAEYLDWLRTSKRGITEGIARNNHGSWYDVQVVCFALFVGEDEYAQQVLADSRERRIAAHIEPDGHQPHELSRTKAWDYSIYSLRALFNLAILGERIGVDLWGYESADGRSLRQALDFLVPYATDPESWPYPQTIEFKPEKLAEPLWQAGRAYAEPEYIALAEQLGYPGGTENQRWLVLPSNAILSR